MELSVRTAADPSTAHLVISPRSKSIITTRTKNKNGLRMIKSGETMVMPILLRRPQLPRVTITTVERNEEKERSRGGPSDVLRILDALQLPVDADTYSALIKECIDSRDAVQGASIHAHIQRRTRSSTRNSSDHLILADRLLLMYAACGRLRDARQLFDEMPIKDAISRLTMVSALSDRGDHVEAIKLFVDMHQNSCAGSRGRGCRAHLFDAAMAILRSCIRAEDLQLGQQVHGLTLKLVGSVACSDSLVVRRLLVRLYSGKYGRSDYAKTPFNAISNSHACQHPLTPRMLLTSDSSWR
ncbi:Tetratricopeptide-like helical domain-containing protein [Dioscorea alata]|uniref:Tetratricopeptide-like helical domain-containing protein n=1 Tax=Dioscorea alata TaxID=55571 RepID=A0ACB7VUK7_DIOAL|nr:Tetratricopeptide-like helical domain-containing protein [Dioscorea alata]